MNKIMNQEKMTRTETVVSEPIKNIIMTQLREHISQNAELTGWDVTIINEKTIELRKRMNDLTYSEKYDEQTFQKMCYNLVNQ